MKPFNLERALAGDPVCLLGTGIPVAQVVKLNASVGPNVCVVFNDQAKLFTTDEAHRCLYMASVKKEGWVNIYDRADGIGRCFGGSMIYDTKEIAIERAGPSVLDTTRIEWEE